jgi:hypothetical protein
LFTFAWGDLHGNYEFSGEEYPLEQKFEIMHQRKGREDIIAEWRVVFNDWIGTAKQQTSILTMLFYAIWAQDISISKKGFTASPSHVFRSYVCNIQLSKRTGGSQADH